MGVLSVMFNVRSRATDYLQESAADPQMIIGSANAFSLYSYRAFSSRPV